MNIGEYLSATETSQQAFAQMAGVSQSRVSQWIAGGRVPAERCSTIEQGTNGAVTRHDLRPDVFGPAPRVDASTEAGREEAAA